MVMPISTRVRQGRYEVDARRVADAILIRIMASPGAAVPSALTHRECSKPASSPSASSKTASG